MKKYNIKKFIALTSIAAVTTSTFTGCKNFVMEDVASYPAINMVQENEIRDYYANALQYDAVVKKNITKHEDTYELIDITGDQEVVLKKLVSKAQEILGKPNYDKTDEIAKNIVSEDVYNYIKASIDNLVLSNGTIVDMKGALGYYFIDMQYKASPQKAATFTDYTDYLGLDGTFVMDYSTKKYKVDEIYILQCQKALNKYFIDNEILKEVDESDKLHIVINDIDSTESNKIEQPTQSSNNKPSTLVDDSIGLGFVLEDNSMVEDDRKVKLDIGLIKKVVGSSLKSKSFLTDLETFVKPSNNIADISGNGIYIEGAGGCKAFGIDNTKISGTVTIRYVFKDSIDGTGSTVGHNIYILDEDLSTGFTVSNKTTAIPEAAETEIRSTIERADRLQANGDLSGMFKSTTTVDDNGLKGVFEDKGIGVLRAYKDKYSNTTKYMSKLNNILVRDKTNNAYLLDVETTVTEGAKSADVNGTYKDTYYMVIQQQGANFVISDMLRTKRELIKEPPINRDNADTVRLVALNLADNLTDTIKENGTKLLSDLYTAGTNKILRGPKEISIRGEKVTIEKGLYDCFNQDTELLSSTKLENMNSKLREQLTKYGNNVKSQHYGIITEWLGGNNKQMEMLTEELITFSGRQDAYYIQVYYLLSNINDKWVIDERRVIDEYTQEAGDTLENMKSRIVG